MYSVFIMPSKEFLLASLVPGNLHKEHFKPASLQFDFHMKANNLHKRLLLRVWWENAPGRLSLVFKTP